MRPVARGVVRWTVRLLAVVAGLGLLYAAVLLYPTPLFAHRASYGAYRVYADEPIAADFGRVIEDLDRRLRAMEHPPPAGGQRIYLCSPRRYAFFAFLTRRSPQSLAIGLSVANESFVSLERVRLFAERNRGVLRHTRFEGNVAEVVAHEVAHFNSVRALGYRAHLRQPLWKSEGWAEYQANLAAIRADPGYDLAQRVGVLLDDAFWGGRGGVARAMWRYQILVEYLGEIEGFRLEDLVEGTVTESAARERMLAWYRAGRARLHQKSEGCSGARIPAA